LRHISYTENIYLRVYAAWIRPTEDDEANSWLGCVLYYRPSRAINICVIKRAHVVYT